MDISRSASQPVSPWLFGKFSKHLGNNIYGGPWSEALAPLSLAAISC
ncbi:hypothetical protein H5P28_03320 [Ruficoccus amylovorans]|uniref:Uncharacterized protein n=1 Tax=Ruficoccus amylovorans TaxID=1804625 RepID=A0A842HCL0_9BACT|nr:hypothetical protein [Ruficoccus amylovorans]MBC2593284.1 hypothetical protein [Ruficoccus amylovorans]